MTVEDVVSLDPHLNVFYSYAQGGDEDMGEEKILENNVTRAFIITLSGSSLVAQLFLKEFFGFETSSFFSYRLQSTLSEFEQPSHNGCFMLAIVRDQQEVERQEIPDSVAQKIFEIREQQGSIDKLRQALVKLEKQVRNNEQVSHSALQEIQCWIPEIVMWLGDDPSLSNLRYLYDLTLGSRPDAIIFAEGIFAEDRRRLCILVESKIHGSIVHTQIQRHILENFRQERKPYYSKYPEPLVPTDRDTIPVRVCTWRQIYSFFKSILTSVSGTSEDRAGFLVKQFIQYLEVIGMGELSFKQAEFLRWQEHYHDDREVAHILLEKIQDLAEELCQLLPGHRIKAQAVRPDYLGVNIVHSKDNQEAIMPVRIPHWSLALQQYGAESHSLRLFIQCESKELVEGLVHRRERLELELVDALRNLKGKTNIALRVREKLHLMYGGKAEVQPLYHVYFSGPLELCHDDNDVRLLVKRAFDSIAHLIDPHVRQERLSKLPEKMTRVKGKTVTGVLQLNYHVNWLELESLGIGISDNLKEVVNWFKPYYDALLKACAEME